MSKTDSNLVIYFVEACTYVIPNISNKPREMCYFIQGNGVFQLVVCLYTFQERVRE